MASLASCPDCRGWVPARASRCPHCGRRAPSAALQLASTVLGLAGAGLAACTMISSYGVPCAADAGCDVPPEPIPVSDAGAGRQVCGLSDGGLSACYPDGGLPDGG